MKLSFKNKNSFCNNFLSPISRLSDLAILTAKNNEIISLNKTADNNSILYAKCSDATLDNDQQVSLNIPDVKKFIKAFDCIEDQNIELTVNSNNIEYKSPKIKFKYHLLEDGIIAPVGLSLSKIQSFEFDVEFTIDIVTFQNLLKCSTFNNSEKIYFYSENGEIHCELTDKSKHNVDSFTTVLAETYQGNALSKPMPFLFDVVRSISTLRSSQLQFKINSSKGILCVEVEEPGYYLKYITTAKVI
jgi:hypothetical protein